MENKRIAAAREIAATLGQLTEVAQQNGLDLLAYLLDLARLEAEREAWEEQPPSF